MKRIQSIIVPIVLLGAVACGTERPDIDVTLEAPTQPEARVSISAALDVTQLLDDGLADRVVIEDITVNLAEVRLLAADPRIPPGGFSLLSRDTLLEFFGNEESKLEFAFPDTFLAQEDLAVYLRVDPSEELEGASIVISGRLYSDAVSGGQDPLSASKDGVQDPDGDPVDDPEEGDSNDTDRYRVQDPDGDPVHPACVQDPDGDPVMCGQRSNLVNRGSESESESIAFELRAHDVADLVATLDPSSALNVVVGIPASRWFTDEVVTALDQALEDKVEDARIPDQQERMDEEEIIIEASQKTDRATSDRMRNGQDDYFVDSRNIDDLTVRR